MELANIQNYEDLKNGLRYELNKTALSFVKIGYLLKLARDGDYLQGSMYTDVTEFARAEFCLDKTQVSRFIRINDRFSIGGYSEHLKGEYEEYGSAKLSLMLTLPDEINEELSPEYSKADIQAIKDEYAEEMKISDIEVILEEQDPDRPDDFIAAIVKQLNDEHPDPVAWFHGNVEIGKNLGLTPGVADAKEAYMPDGDRTYNIRLSGQGRFMVNMKEGGISIVNMRAPEEKSTLSWEEFLTELLKDEAGREFVVVEPAEKKPKKVEPSKTAREQKEAKKPAQKKPDSVPKEPESVRNELESAQEEPESVQKEPENVIEPEKAEVAPVQQSPLIEKKAYGRFMAVTAMNRKRVRTAMKILDELLPAMDDGSELIDRKTARDFSEFAADLHKAAVEIYESYDYYENEIEEERA
jgi:hypothetical protein